MSLSQQPPAPDIYSSVGRPTFSVSALRALTSPRSEIISVTKCFQSHEEIMNRWGLCRGQCAEFNPHLEMENNLLYRKYRFNSVDKKLSVKYPICILSLLSLKCCVSIVLLCWRRSSGHLLGSSLKSPEDAAKYLSRGVDSGGSPETVSDGRFWPRFESKHRLPGLTEWWLHLRTAGQSTVPPLNLQLWVFLTLSRLIMRHFPNTEVSLR